MPKLSKDEPPGFTNCDSETIRRLINNQKQEHTSHAFRAGHAGMDDFKRLLPVLRSLPSAELEQWMDLIDKMGETHQDCLPCSCKVLVYSFLFTIDILPVRSAGYKRLYEQSISRRPPPEGRNYLAEVIQSLREGPETPEAIAHKRYWRVALENILTEQLQGG